VHPFDEPGALQVIGHGRHCPAGHAGELGQVDRRQWGAGLAEEVQALEVGHAQSELGGHGMVEQDRPGGELPAHLLADPSHLILAKGHADLLLKVL